ncbi:MAG: hypothetical protein HOP23_16515 [Methylococcaceae bacterium]|nr:hypothetical protein [Methylococcaceae bacterium]
MKRYNNGVWFFILMIVTNTGWAYGGGGSSSSKACAKPKFTNFVPAENAEAKASSAFSFTASKNTYPNSIKVTVKDLPANVKVTPKNDGSFDVNGTLPASLKGPYARIAITADALSNCNGAGGWLVKIAE